MKLQVRHYPQIPCKPFCVDVANEKEALKIINTLADQHLWLFENKIIPDYSNVIGVYMWVEEGNIAGWESYYNEELSMDWDEYVENVLNQVVETDEMSFEQCQKAIHEKNEQMNNLKREARELSKKAMILSPFGIGDKVLVNNIETCYISHLGYSHSGVTYKFNKPKKDGTMGGQGAGIYYVDSIKLLKKAKTEDNS